MTHMFCDCSMLTLSQLNIHKAINRPLGKNKSQRCECDVKICPSILISRMKDFEFIMCGQILGRSFYSSGKKTLI